MSMTREQEHLVRELNARLSRAFIQGINAQPDEQIAHTISQLQAAFQSQNGADPRQNLRGWFKPLRGFVDALDDRL